MSSISLQSGERMRAGRENRRAVRALPRASASRRIATARRPRASSGRCRRRWPLRAGWSASPAAGARRRGRRASADSSGRLLQTRTSAGRRGGTPPRCRAWRRGPLSSIRASGARPGARFVAARPRGPGGAAPRRGRAARRGTPRRRRGWWPRAAARRGPRGRPASALPLYGRFARRASQLRPATSQAIEPTSSSRITMSSQTILGRLRHRAVRRGDHVDDAEDPQARTKSRPSAPSNNSIAPPQVAVTSPGYAAAAARRARTGRFAGVPRLGDLIAVLEGWFDPRWAESWDAVGLVCGDPDEPVERVCSPSTPCPRRSPRRSTAARSCCSPTTRCC